MSATVTFHKILIANRGEIALRVIRTAREMGIATVAVYSIPDTNAPFVQAADEAVALPGSTAAETYLNQDLIISAAKRTGAQAVHPGYGFLSENASFAQRCADEGLIFIGPRPEVIKALGDKKRAKEIARTHKVPVIPGYEDDDQSVEALTKAAKDIGFPVLLKASAGGGGKGMRIVREEKSLTKEIDAAKRESMAAFGDDTLLIEKYFESARHIEVQILGDNHGHVVHLFERECSIQRRYQKIIEESPSPVLTDELRDAITSAAINAAKAVNYNNAGTVEFILAPDGQFCFLEVNTRLQVEHPVTEAITGLDLVRLQLEVAQGHPLTLKQDDITATGHAIEVRLYAEDPANNYLPVTGHIYKYEPYLLSGLRYDSGIESGSDITAFYDPMIAKVIAYGADRDEAARKLSLALTRTVFSGPVNNKAFLVKLLRDERFASADFDTRFLEHHPELTETIPPTESVVNEALIAATLFQWQRNSTSTNALKAIPSGWRNNFYQSQFLEFRLNEVDYKVNYRFQRAGFKISIGDTDYSAVIVKKADDGKLRISIDGLTKSYTITQATGLVFVNHPDFGDIMLHQIPRFPDVVEEQAKGSYLAPMPGQIVKVCVKPGDKIEPGDALVVINSMKMENTIEAFEAGEVEEVYVEANGFVEADTMLLKLKT